jgi:hypothetical protein
VGVDPDGGDPEVGVDPDGGDPEVEVDPGVSSAVGVDPEVNPGIGIGSDADSGVGVGVGVGDGFGVGTGSGGQRINNMRHSLFAEAFLTAKNGLSPEIVINKSVRAPIIARRRVK